MNKPELDLVLRAVGRYVRKITGGVSDEIKSLREKIDRFSEGASDADIGWTERGTLRGALRAATDPLAKRLDAVEALQPQKGDKGDPGPAPTTEMIRSAVEAYLHQHPPQKGEKGDAGQPPDQSVVAGVVEGYLRKNPPPPGPKGDPGAAPEPAAIAAAVEGYLKQNPPPPGPKGDPGAPGKQGDRGDPGADAVVDHDQVVGALKGIHEEFVARFQLDLERKAMEFERRCMDAVQAAVAAIPPPKEGAPGPKGDPGERGDPGQKGDQGQPGRDGLGFDDVEFDYDGERTVTAKFVRGGSILKSVPWKLPVIIDRGYWKQGFKAERGDAVTEGGTLYIALRDTAEKPGTGAKDWRIGARKGRDGTPAPVKLTTS